MEKEEILKEVTKIIRFYLPARSYKIFLFGSWTKGTALEVSDLDIGILGRKELPWDVLFRIKKAVEGIPTLRKTDIVDLKSVGKDFRENVLHEAKELK